METIEKASTIAHETVDKIANVTSQAVEAIDEKGEKLKHTEQLLMKNCQGYIRDNPVTSLGIARGGRLPVESFTKRPLDRKTLWTQTL
ncbi:MAG: DUF883 domain-containing protein [Gammaproteobacteria bacterium]